MKTNLRILFAVIAIAAFVGVARANVSLPDVIGEHMVLQQNQRVPIWGTADPGDDGRDGLDQR